LVRPLCQEYVSRIEANWRGVSVWGDFDWIGGSYYSPNYGLLDLITGDLIDPNFMSGSTHWHTYE
jgi:hypothetical protein